MSGYLLKLKNLSNDKVQKLLGAIGEVYWLHNVQFFYRYVGRNDTLLSKTIAIRAMQKPNFVACSTRHVCLFPIGTIKLVAFCEVKGCFHRVVSFPPFHDAFLFEQYGKELHRYHRCCPQHIGRPWLRVLKSIEVVNLTPNQPKYWDKIVSWHKGKGYYAQHIGVEWDGDHEVGYVDCDYAFEWHGPYPTREEAMHVRNGTIPESKNRHGIRI